MNCAACGKPVQFVWDVGESRMIPESKYWYSIDFGPIFTEVFCNPTCMLIRHYIRGDKKVPDWVINEISK